MDDIVIIGGGIIGTASAYFLSKEGRKVRVIEQDPTYKKASFPLSLGGFRRQFFQKENILLGKFAREFIFQVPELLKTKDNPKPTASVVANGYLFLFGSEHAPEQYEALKNHKQCEAGTKNIKGTELKKKFPYVNDEGIETVTYTDDKKEGWIDPYLFHGALKNKALELGAEFDKGEIRDISEIKANVIICAVGYNTNNLLKDVPVVPQKHTVFRVSCPKHIPEMPLTSDFTTGVYWRPEGKEYLAGSPISTFGAKDLEPDWDHFKVFWNSATYRVPEMKKAGINRFYVSAESFTPDNNYILGESPEVKNFFVAAGLNSNGIAGGPAVGKITAEWIVNGHPNTDVVDADIKRFSSFSNNKKYLYDRTVENVGTLYGMHWPNLQPETARNIRKSPIHNEIESLGACFGVMSGWERANWFAPNGIKPEYKYSFQKQNWFKYSEKEHVTVRNEAGLFDQSSFAKFLLQGNDSEIVLQRICANQINVPIGKIVYTAMLNSRGGIEADITITKLDQTSFMIVTGPGVSSRDFYWIKNHINKHEHAILTDVTSGYGVLGLMGPKSRKILEKLTPDDVSNEGFPYLTSKKIEIGYGEIIASRVTYVGELGWELYIPSEFMKNIFTIILEEGKSQGMCLAGYHALDSLRLEKSYRSWGHDITYLDTPIEAGLNFAVDMNKNEFIGKKALIEQKKNNSIPKRLAVFILKDSSPLLLGDEPIFRNGELVGIVTSGNYGHSIGKSVGLGYLENESGVDIEFLKNGDFEIQIGLKKYPTDVQFRPPYDPKNEKVKI